MKYFLGLIVVLLPAIALFPVPTIAQPCANYWTNPKTGQQECLTVTSKPSLVYIGKMNRISDRGQKIVARFYTDNNITFTNNVSKPVRQVVTLSSGYRFENRVIVDCKNIAIAYLSSSIKLRGKLIADDKYEPPEFENVSEFVDVVGYNYICNGVKPK